MSICTHTPVDAVLRLHMHTGANVQVCKSPFPTRSCSLGVPGRRPPVSCPRARRQPALPPCLPRVPTGSRSEGLRSPSESVFLRMEGIPFIQEELADNEENSKRQSESGRGRGGACPWGQQGLRCPGALQPGWAFADSECCSTVLEAESPGKEAGTSSSPSSSEETLGRRLLRSLSE